MLEINVIYLFSTIHIKKFVIEINFKFMVQKKIIMLYKISFI